MSRLRRVELHSRFFFMLRDFLLYSPTRTVTQGHATLAGTYGFSPMSRLRRLQLHSRFFFITCNLKRGVRPLHDHEFKLLAKALTSVRRKVPFALCGYCFMPDHWHAILLPEDGTSISDILMRIKIATYHGSARLANVLRQFGRAGSTITSSIGVRNSIKLSRTCMRIPRSTAWLETQSIGSGPAQLGM